MCHCSHLHTHSHLNPPRHIGHAPEHDIVVASGFGMLGSIDANTGVSGVCLLVKVLYSLVMCRPSIFLSCLHGSYTQSLFTYAHKHTQIIQISNLGWDTDCFMTDTQSTTLIMKTVLEQGGIQPGGFNFDAKVRRESTDVEDMFIAHIMGMDAFAKG